MKKEHEEAAAGVGGFGGTLPGADAGFQITPG